MRLLSKLNLPKILLSTNSHKVLRYQQSQDAKTANNQFFEKVAQIYNQFHEVVTIGMHKKWRQTIIDDINLTKDTQVLDAAGGTGLNTVRLLEKAKHFEPDSKFQITVFDLSPYMLKVAENDCKRLGYNLKFVKFIEGDLQQLPFANESFDTVILSFAIRGTADFNLIFEELNRVLKSEGKMLVFDFNSSQKPTITQRLYYNYILWIVPIIEMIKWGNLEASKYVTDTIRDTLRQIDIKTTMRNANFKNITFKPLSLGITGITTGYKM